jgi:hypothetical protein
LWQFPGLKPKRTMKLFLYILFFLGYSNTLGAQIDSTAKSSDYALMLTLDGAGLVEWNDGRTTLNLFISLQNHSSDTLRYFSMLCSWMDLYVLNSNQFKFPPQLCQINVGCIEKIPPGESNTVYIRLLSQPNTDLNKIALRVGFNLMKADAFQKGTDLNYHDYREKKHLIWSNEITIE